MENSKNFNKVVQNVKQTLENKEIDPNVLNTLFSEILKRFNFTPEQILIIHAVNYNICSVCRDAPAGCHCWDDE